MNCVNCKVWTNMSSETAQRVCAACQKKMAAMKAKGSGRVRSS